MTTRMLELLPSIYREDPFLGQFLLAFEELLLGSDDSAPLPGQPRALEKQIDAIADNFDAQHAPAELLDWLASWLALSLRADLSEQQQRDFLASTAQRYRRRGTPGNLEKLLKIITQGKPHVVEDGLPAHHFAVEFGLLPQSQYGGLLKDYPAYIERQSTIARDVIELEKPAHTAFELRPMFPTLRISPKTAVSNAATPGYFSTIGVDTLLGARVLDPVPPTVSVSAHPDTVSLGHTTTLSWSSTNAADISAGGDWSGKLAAAGSQTVTPTAVGSASYTLTCLGVPGSGGSATQVATATATAVVIVKPALPTGSIVATPATITLGQSSLLSWTSANDTSCIASGDWSGELAVSGSQAVTPATVGSASYTLSFTGDGGSSVTTAVVTVLPPAPVVTITAAPAAFVLGQSTTLSWSSTDATSAMASDAWSGDQPVTGSLQVTPAAAGSYRYVISSKGDGGKGSAAVVITVSPPPPLPTLSINATPATILLGQAATLSWSSTGASSVVANTGWNGPRDLSGSLVVTPSAVGSVTYGLSCDGPGGSAVASAVLKVNPPVPTMTLTASANPTWVGNPTTLTWTSTDATGGTASGGATGSGWSGTRGPKGSFTFTPTAEGTARYTLQLNGPSGSTAASVTLNVGPAGTRPTSDPTTPGPTGNTPSTM